MGSDAGVAGDNRHALGDRLGGKQTVEGVAVRLAVQIDEGKPAVGGRMRDRDRQQREALGEQLLGPLLGGFKLAEGGLDRNLEQRPGAEERLF